MDKLTDIVYGILNLLAALITNLLPYVALACFVIVVVILIFSVIAILVGWYSR